MTSREGLFGIDGSAKRLRTSLVGNPKAGVIVADLLQREGWRPGCYAEVQENHRTAALGNTTGGLTKKEELLVDGFARHLQHTASGKNDAARCLRAIRMHTLKRFTQAGDCL